METPEQVAFDASRVPELSTLPNKLRELAKKILMRGNVMRTQPSVNEVRKIVVAVHNWTRQRIEQHEGESRAVIIPIGDDIRGDLAVITGNLCRFTGRMMVGVTKNSTQSQVSRQRIHDRLLAFAGDIDAKLAEGRKPGTRPLKLPSLPTPCIKNAYFSYRAAIKESGLRGTDRKRIFDWIKKDGVEVNGKSYDPGYFKTWSRYLTKSQAFFGPLDAIAEPVPEVRSAQNYRDLA